MADNEDALESALASLQGETGASETDAASATADQGTDASGAQVSAEDIAKLNQRINDTRSQHDRERDEWKAEKGQLMELLGKQGGDSGQREADAAVAQARKELEKKYDDGELTGAQLIGLLDEVAREAREGALSEASTKLTAAEQERKEIREALDALRADSDPAYVSQREKVDAAVEAFGVTRAQAMKIVAASAPAQPPRPAAAGGMATGVVSSGDDGGVDAKTAALVAGLAASTTGRLPTESEMAKLQQKWKK